MSDRAKKILLLSGLLLIVLTVLVLVAGVRIVSGCEMGAGGECETYWEWILW